jgi:hypothetical protein
VGGSPGDGSVRVWFVTGHRPPHILFGIIAATFSSAVSSMPHHVPQGVRRSLVKFSIFVHAIIVRYCIYLGVFIAFLALGEACSAANAASFGRISSTGAWSDQGWIDDAGVVAGLPAGPVDSIWIGGQDRPSPGALAVAMVVVDGTVSAGTIAVGDSPGDVGTLVVVAGSELTAQTILLGRNGGAAELSIEAGGKLTTHAILQAGSPSGSASIRLNGQSATTSQFIQTGAIDLVRDGGGIHGEALWVLNPNAHFEYTAADSFNSGVVDAGASLTFSAPASFLGGLRVGGGATVVVDAPLDVAGDFNGLSVTGVGTTFIANAIWGQGFSLTTTRFSRPTWTSKRFPASTSSAARF